MVSFKYTFFILLMTWQVGCATYHGKVSGARLDLEMGRYTSAQEKLKPLALEPSKDQLVYLLDYATALHISGEFDESSKYFIAADKIAEEKDYISITKQAGSILFAQELVQYSGADYEILLINAVNALNFALKNDLEGARVETRRLTEKLEFYRSEQKRNYNDNTLAFYLNAHIWEANKNWDSAFIDFEKAYKNGLNNELIQRDLLRAAQRSRRYSKLKKYSSEFGIKPGTQYKDKKLGEVVVLYQQGWGPRRYPDPVNYRMPSLKPVWSRTQTAKVLVAGEEKGKTSLVYDLETDAIKTFNEEYGPLIAKRLAAIAAKQVVSHQVAKENQGLGAILNIAMHASDRADLRHWSTLPQTIQAAHLYLPEGTHSMQFKGLMEGGEESGQNSQELQVEVKAGKKTFVGWRSF